MTQFELPDLEQTLGDIVLELLRAPQVYPGLILSAPLDGTAEYSSNSISITHHYTDALLAYGYTPEQPELASARQWFSTPFPNGTRSYIDQDEMNRLEVLLHLNPPDPYIQARLQRLVTQRDAAGRFNIRVNSMNFGTLLSVKVLYMAHQGGALQNVLDLHELKQYTNTLVNGDHPDKDLALALRLRYELYNGGLTQPQRKQLSALVERAAARGGAWDVPDALIWAVEQMRDGQLTVGDVADLHNEFHDIIVSTCYVIENLAPLMREYSEVMPAIHAAMRMWWRLFAGEEALERLRVLFPLDWQYLMVLSRTLVAVQALYKQYSNAPLMHRCSPYLLRRLAQQNAPAPRDADEENIRKALRKWLLIELDGKPHSLRMGVSGADVVRVKPDVRSPLDENSRLSLPDSLVVKSGSIEAINKERDNYQSLPNALRASFVQIPRPSYIDRKTRRAYVIMSDLHQFWTLQEAACDNALLPNTLSRELGDFLIAFHRGGGAKRAIEPGLLRDLYLMPMQGYVRQIFPFLTDYDLLSAEQQQQTLLLQDALYDLIGGMVRKPLQFEALPVAYMHGDLHSRNIMIRKLSRNGHYQERQEFKLIDLEKLRRDGDAALDLGELLSDLEILGVNKLRQRPNYDPVLKLAAGLEKSYLRYARDREDTMFTQRLSLARAWAMLRFAKGNTRHGVQWLQQKRTRQARNTADEVLHFTRRAYEHLQKITEMGY
jgi:hypothetical protein